MSANVERFDQVTSFPQRVYLDTNYLLHLKSYPSDPARHILKSSKDFYNKLVQHDVKLITSILTIEEAFHIILYRIGIAEDMSQFTDRNGKPFESISQFRKQKPKEFKKSYKKHFSKVYSFLQFLYSLGVEISYAKAYITPGMNSISKRITQYAYGLLKRYELEAMDAFHVAVSKCMGIDHIVTNDTGFKVIDNITLYIYK